MCKLSLFEWCLQYFFLETHNFPCQSVTTDENDGIDCCLTESAFDVFDTTRDMQFGLHSKYLQNCMLVQVVVSAMNSEEELMSLCETIKESKEHRHKLVGNNKQCNTNSKFLKFNFRKM